MIVNLKSQISNLKSECGFTLIELIVAVSVISILSVLGIAGFNNYNQVQVLQTATNDVANMLNLAKSRALSQVKLGPTCGQSSNVLGRYEVRIIRPSRRYRLVIRCGTEPPPYLEFIDIISDKRLPPNIRFDVSRTFIFPVPTGAAITNSQFILTEDGGHARTIRVDSLGGITIQ